MAAAVRRARRRWPAFAGAALAGGFIVAMVLSGGRPQSQWLVRTDAAGVMRETPDRISRVEVTADGRRLAFVRAASGWTTAAPERPVPAALAADLELGLRFMHVSAPVRVMPRAEHQATPLQQFGLDPPRYTISLSTGARPVLEARFGAPNPQKVLQYMQLRGRDDVYLMSRFVGQKWEAIVAGAGS